MGRRIAGVPSVRSSIIGARKFPCHGSCANERTLLPADEYFMRLALREARAGARARRRADRRRRRPRRRGDRRGRNERELREDPTAHAEVLALREAARGVGSWRVLDCGLYVTLEPCAMCAGAIVLARVPAGRLRRGRPEGGRGGERARRARRAAAQPPPAGRRRPARARSARRCCGSSSPRAADGAARATATLPVCCPAAPRRGAGVVERGGLENRCAAVWSTVGSNPTPSADSSYPSTRSSPAGILGGHVAGERGLRAGALPRRRRSRQGNDPRGAAGYRCAGLHRRC